MDHQQILHPLCNRERGPGSAETLRPFDLTTRTSRVVGNQYPNTARFSQTVNWHVDYPVWMLSPYGCYLLNAYQINRLS